LKTLEEPPGHVIFILATTDRAYRIGQKRFVHVHKLITTGTLEEKIDEMLERKQSLNNAVITSDSWMTELSTDELKELLGV
ncbi:hypothetical protein ACT4US_14695, partial [Bacillus sp. HC-Mk]